MTQIKITQDETIKMASDLMRRFSELVNELSPEVYSSSDLIMYADDWQKMIDNEVEPENWDNFIKNLRLFTEVVGAPTERTQTKKDKSYFRGFDKNSLAHYALYLANQYNDDVSMMDEKEMQEYCQEKSGDDYVKVLYEGKNYLVVLSVDSCIEVVNHINKYDINKSMSTELAY